MILFLKAGITKEEYLDGEVGLLAGRRKKLGVEDGQRWRSWEEVKEKELS